ncbi:hypothetical protein [Citrobacter arsenatis]|uniref:hypothetical protein n=1 Tax=Citrobacter arsenatis TaxID=2546350 RepID=UPI00300DC8B2
MCNALLLLTVLLATPSNAMLNAMTVTGLALAFTRPGWLWNIRVSATTLTDDIRFSTTSTPATT